MRRRFVSTAALAFAAIVALGEGAATGGEAAAQLDYVGAPGCPGTDAFETTVADHLGYSPFRPEAIERVVVRIEASGRGLEGRIEWRNEAGRWAGDRTFPSRTGDCGELVRVMGFAVALQFQLLAAAAAPSPEPIPPPPEGTPAPPAAPPAVIAAPSMTSRPEPIASPSTPASITVGAGAVAGVGLSPGVAALGRLFGIVAWPHVAVELSAEVSVPTTMHRADGAGFDHQVFLAGAAGCGVRGRWSACLLGKVGEIRVVGEGVDAPATASGVFIQSGLRLAVTQMLGSRAQIVLHGDGLALLTRGIVTLDSMPVWTTPRVAGALGLDLGVRFR